MLLRLAWRNIWRNKRRSLIVMGSVIIGVISIIFMDGFGVGWMNQMLFNQISLNTSHVQIHKTGFNDNKVIQNYILDYPAVENVLKGNPNIVYYSKRAITFGLLSSASNSSGVYVYGIIPEAEQNVSMIKKSIIEGKYLSGDDREVIMGTKLAEKLGVTLGDKVVVMVNTPDGSIGSDVFRIVGMFKTPSSEYDKAYIYVNLSNAQRMMEIGDEIYEYAIIANDYHNAGLVRDQILSKLDKRYEVFSYTDLLPMLVMQMDMMDEYMGIFYFIIGLAMIFGIINVMLMAVFERIHEFGVLMSIGMKNRKLFTMVVYEALILGIIGTIAGLILGIIIMYPMTIYGINFGDFASSLDSLGIGAIIYPELVLEKLITTFIIIPFMVALGAVYPAVKAIKLEPVYALRYV
ncbi:MAG: hypothetical protein A2V66_08520 [Ignavibacteria bacterium RBG_13_36_8]|nr:MAG: hypothetical protein A2V66_08520 [Ignavibacteria bacterium RBG_13_36_8]